MSNEERTGPDWLQPMIAQSGLRRFVEVVRGQYALVLVILACTVGVAAIYLLATDDTYEANASMLVAPVPADDPLLSGLGLIRESNDPTLDVQTAAQLITTSDVAAKAAVILGTNSSPEDLRAQVRAEPVGQSNVVAILAEASSAEEASNLANAFGEAVVEVRTDQLHERIDAVLPSLQEQLRDLGEGGLAAEALAEQVIQLQSLRAGPDTTIQLETPASVPSEPIWPRPVLVLAAAILLGLVLGMSAAYLARALDPRLRREEQLREIFRLPVLARIPLDSEAKADQPLGPTHISAPTLEGYRTLRSTLMATRGEDGEPPRSLLITSPSPSDGKTTTAVSLAVTLARAGRSVILIEADLRRPAIGRALGVSSKSGMFDVLAGGVKLGDALVSTPSIENLSLLLAGARGEDATDLLGLQVGRQLIEDAESMADFVIVDSAPLTAVIDSMPLARWVDGVLIVVRYGKTHLRRTRELGEILAANGVTPVGFALLGVRIPHGDYQNYYFEAASETRRGRQEDQPARGF